MTPAALSSLLCVSLATAQPSSAEPTPPPTLPSSAQPAPSTALSMDGGLGRGVHLRSADGDYHLQLRARLQLRGALVVDEDADVDAGEDVVRPELLVRRARIVIAGDAFDEVVTWYLQLGISPNDVEDLPIIVRDAIVAFRVNNAVQLRLGQQKVPFDRQRVTSSSAIQFAERSTVVNELNLDRDIGGVVVVDVIDERVVFQGGVFGGDGRNRPVPTLTPLLSGRVQWTPFGSFDDLVEGDLEHHDDAKVAVAAAVAYNAGTTRSRSTFSTQFDGEVDYLHATVDGLFKWRGTSVMVSGIGRSALSTRGAARARNGVGVVGQAGHFVTDGLELVARAAALGPVSPLGDASSVVVDDGLRRQLEFALGANLFFVGQGLKLQLDAGTIAPEGERPDLVARAQLQIFL